MSSFLRLDLWKILCTPTEVHITLAEKLILLFPLNKFI